MSGTFEQIIFFMRIVLSKVQGEFFFKYHWTE